MPLAYTRRFVRLHGVHNGKARAFPNPDGKTCRVVVAFDDECVIPPKLNFHYVERDKPWADLLKWVYGLEFVTRSFTENWPEYTAKPTEPHGTFLPAE